MAAYDYRCRVCDLRFEVRRAVTDDGGTTTCPRGHADVTRIWSAVAVTGRAGGSSGPAPAPAMAGGGCCGGGCGCG